MEYICKLYYSYSCYFYFWVFSRENTLLSRLLYARAFPMTSSKRDPFLPLERSANRADCTEQALYLAAARLLGQVFDRDSRRPFTDEKHWLTTDVSMKTFESEMDKERVTILRSTGGASAGASAGSSGHTGGHFQRAHCVLHRLPQVLPHKLRVRLLQDTATRAKATLARVRTEQHIRSPLLTIRRSHLITDGFRELTRLDVQAMKDTIKIRFINAQGLEEAGIDENGTRVGVCTAVHRCVVVWWCGASSVCTCAICLF